MRADDDYTGSISFHRTNLARSMLGSHLRGRDSSSKLSSMRFGIKDSLWMRPIHGTGMDQSQFNKMGTTGAGLVWSPFANLVLCGDTTDVVAADNAGITISIAPDWGPMEPRITCMN